MSQQADQPGDRPALLGGKPLFANGPPDWPIDDLAVAEALARAVADRSWGKYHGGHCERLVERLSQIHGCKHVVLCSSGTAAVELALRGLQVGAGDEVILAAYDFKANFQNVLTVGALPVLVDVNAENWNLDPANLCAAVTAKTKAIIVSHLHGGVVPMPAVMEIAKELGVPVIEDACQSPGARLFGKPAGTWGDVGILSFGGSKLLTAGRGGALVTNNDDLVQRVRLYTYRGNEAYPLSELQAAALLPQLERLDERNRRRAANVESLCVQLAKFTGLSPFRNLAGDIEPSYYKVGFQYDPAAFGGLPRERFVEAMRAEGVAFDAGFRGLHLIHGSRRFRAAGELPHATDADNRVLTLHHPVLLEPQEAIDGVAAAVARVRRFAEELTT